MIEKIKNINELDRFFIGLILALLAVCFILGYIAKSYYAEENISILTEGQVVEKEIVDISTTATYTVVVKTESNLMFRLTLSKTSYDSLDTGSLISFNPDDQYATVIKDKPK